jgi:glutamate racemase
MNDYDSVAGLYAKVFQDIRVRQQEVNWLLSRLPKSEFSLLELGCGSGALLDLLSPRIKRGLGVDVSEAMMKIARKRNQKNQNISFGKINDFHLPVKENAVFDIVVSMLSWRYVHWLPMLREIFRILKPGGRLLLIDMTSKKAGFFEIPFAFLNRLRTILRNLKYPEFNKNLGRLVQSSDWKKMVANNPEKKYSEYVSFFKKYLPGFSPKIIDRSMRSRIFALDSGKVAAYSGEATAILDWGIGGFSIYKLIRAEFPNAALFYFSDSGFKPYGKCSRRVLVRRLQQLADFFLLQGIRRIIVACNAMSTILDSADLIIPDEMEICGVIQPTLDFLLNRKPEKVAVIGGRMTIKSGSYRKKLADHHQLSESIAQPLSALIERGDRESELLGKTIMKIVTPLNNSASMVLACTHYPAVLPVFKRLLPKMEFIDPVKITYETIVRNWYSASKEQLSLPQDDIILTSGSSRATMEAAALAFGVQTKEVKEVNLNLSLRG